MQMNDKEFILIGGLSYTVFILSVIPVMHFFVVTGNPFILMLYLGMALIALVFSRYICFDLKVKYR